MTFNEAYNKALQQVPRDLRWNKTDNGDWERIDLNERQRRELALEIFKEAEE